jgi:hypothetical protein
MLPEGKTRNKRRRRFNREKEERKLKKVIKSIGIPKSLFIPHSVIIFISLLFMLPQRTSERFTFLIVTLMIPAYYYKVKKSIDNYYNKKLREHNIPYENEAQKEQRNRQETVEQRIQRMMKGTKWDEEEYNRKYSWWEIIWNLIYYFFMSFFPGYIERQLDIFQREHNLLESKKRIRDKKREYQRRLEEQRAKEQMEMQEKQDTFVRQEPSQGDDPVNDLDKDPIIEDEED